MISIEAHLRLSNTACCDPPYWDNAGNGVVISLAHYERMAQLARSMRGHMIISVNDHLEMCRVFASLPMQTVAIDFTVGGGQGVRAQELVIGNWLNPQGDIERSFAILNERQRPFYEHQLAKAA